jgi:hypothetical protein
LRGHLRAGPWKRQSPLATRRAAKSLAREASEAKT